MSPKRQRQRNLELIQAKRLTYSGASCGRDGGVRRGRCDRGLRESEQLVQLLTLSVGWALLFGLVFSIIAAASAVLATSLLWRWFLDFGAFARLGFLALLHLRIRAPLSACLHDSRYASATLFFAHVDTHQHARAIGSAKRARDLGAAEVGRKFEGENSSTIIRHKNHGRLGVRIEGNMRQFALAHHLLVAHGFMLVFGKVKNMHLPTPATRYIMKRK